MTLAVHQTASFGTVKLGKAAAKHDDRTLLLARYTAPGATRTAPKKFDVSTGVAPGAWGMDANDRLGDCTIAAQAHMVEGWTAAAGDPQTVPEARVVAVYWATGTQDDGRSEIDVLNHWRKIGLGPDKIEAYAAIKASDHAMVRYATATFGGLYIGLALPLSAQGQANWSLVRGSGSEPGSWGGHAVNVVGYDSRGVKLVTWGKVIRATWGFLGRYMDEAYAVLSRDWLNAAGVTPAGVDLGALRADLASVTA